jgi:hypothetical protein
MAVIYGSMMEHECELAGKHQRDGEEKCRGRDLNPRTTKDKTLNLTPLARLGYPCLSISTQHASDTKTLL